MSSPQIIVAPEPFTPRVERLSLPALGQNVAQILAAACNSGALAVDDLERARVYLNGEVLEGDGWLDVVPREGDVVNVTVEPLGGGGGNGNKVLQTILTIAIIAVSFWVGGPAGPLATSNVLIRTAAAAAINVGGQALMAGLFKPPTPDSPEEANARGALAGTTNQFRLRGPMPLALGRGRYALDLAAGPYTQTEGDDVWLIVMFGLHYGPVALSDIQIGNVALEDWPAEDVQIETFLTPGPRASTLYPGRVVQENFTDELEDSGAPAAEVHTTATDAERIEVDIVLPGGLSYTNEKGKFLEAGAHFLIEVQPVGGGPWTPAAVPPAAAPSGPLAPGSVYVQRASRDPVRVTASFVPPAKGQWNVRVAMQPGFVGEGTLVNNAVWTALRTMEAEKPVVDETLSLLVMKIRSAGDLNGNLPTVSAELEPIVPVWNGDDWETEAASSNAAALARWLLTGPPAARPYPPEQIHPSIEEAFDLIEANDWTGAYDLREEVSQRDALIVLGKMGRFSTYWNGRQMCFVPDWEKPVPRQIFTGRNASGYRYQRVFPDPIHAVIVEYQQIDTTAPTSELFVYADGYDETNAELFETHRLDYAASIDRAFREGRAYLAKRALQVEVHEWQAGADSVAATYGARVLVRHQATLYGLAEARVDARRWQGALVAGVRIDEPIVLEPGKAYGLDVRRADVVIRGVPILNPGDGVPTRELTFGAPRAEELAPEAGDLIVIGELGTITEDLEILDVDPSSEGGATFRGMRYIGPELEAAETGPIPPLDSPVAPRQAAPVPRILGANGSPDGVTVAFDVDPVRSALVSGFKVRMRRSAIEGSANPWTPLPDLGAADRFLRTPPITDAASPPDGDVLAEYRLDVEIRSVLRSGAISNPARANSILVRRGVPAVRAFLAQGLAIEAPDGSKYPAIVVTAEEFEAGIVQDLNVEIRPHGGAADAWRPAGPPAPAMNPRVEVLDVDSGRSYDVRGRWRSADNWFGPWSTREDVLVPAGSRVSFAAATVGGLTPEELQEALEAASSIGSELTQRLKELAAASLEHSVRIEADVRYAEELTHLDGKPFGVVMVEERETRESADEVFARTFDLMGGVIGDFEAFALDELMIQVRPGESLASWRQSLEAASADALVLITDEATARATADDVFGRWFSHLGAERPGQAGWNLSEAAVYLADGNSFSTYRSQTAAEIGDTLIAVSNEQIARIQGDTAIAGDISNLSLQVSGFSGSITTLQQVTSGLGAEYTLSLNVNGHVSGFRTFNNGLVSSMIFSASEIGFSNGASTVFPLAIIGGVVRATNFEADRVRAGSIVADSIVGGAVSNMVGETYGGSTGLAYGSPSTNIYTRALTTAGGKVSMIFTVTTSVQSGGPAGVLLALYRNGQQIGTQKSVRSAEQFTSANTIMFHDENPGVGTQNYELRGGLSPNSGLPTTVVEVASLFTELKK